MLHATRSKGFTLIEILVTIVIVGIILTASIPAFRNYRFRNELSQAAQMVQSSVYETRNLALAPQADKQEDTGYYVIEFNSETDEMLMYEAADKNGVYDEKNLVKKIYLPEKVKFSSDLSSNKIVFSIKDQGRIVTPEEDITIGINHEKIKNNNTKVILVNHVTGQASIE